VKLTAVALIIVLPIRYFVAQPFIVSGASMEPTFYSKEYLVIDELSYRFIEPQRGDIVIFRYPYDPAIYFIKRIVGLPNETVDVKDGLVSIRDAIGNTTILSEPYVALENGKKESNSVTLEDNEFFVLGDNRNESSDSRVWWPLDKKFIIGRAFARLLPVQQIKLFPGAHHVDLLP